MNFLKRCWQKRWLRRLTWTVVILTVLIASLYAWVNWSGARQLRKVEAMLKAEGETLGFRETMNEPVPEAENFCAIPLLKDLALIVDNDANKGGPGENRKRLEAMRLPSSAKGVARQPKYANAAIGKRTDFKAWADFLRKDGSFPMPADSGDGARDVLAALSKYDAIVQELAAGLNRSKTQWTPEWKTRELSELLAAIQVPHYSSVTGVNNYLSLRVAVAAHTGEVAKAHEAAQLIARFSQASMNDPMLIGLLVGASGAEILHHATWELCAKNAGNMENFTKLESTIRAFDFQRTALRAFRSEIAANVSTIQFIKRKSSNSLEQLIALNSDGRSKGRAFERVIKSAMLSVNIDASAALIADRGFRYLIKPLRDHGWQAARKASQEWEKELAEMHEHRWSHPSYIIPLLLVPAYSIFINKSIFTQALVNQSIIACALERYRIEKGSYPDSLDAVRLADGKPLPLDPIHEKPMGYRNTADGKYALWSVGFDGKDDGGKRTLNEKKPENTQFHKADYVGDWVWDFPAE